jgi:hypothetical protein
MFTALHTAAVLGVDSTTSIVSWQKLCSTCIQAELSRAVHDGVTAVLCNVLFCMWPKGLIVTLTVCPCTSVCADRVPLHLCLR